MNKYLINFVNLQNVVHLVTIHAATFTEALENFERVTLHPQSCILLIIKGF